MIWSIFAALVLLSLHECAVIASSSDEEIAEEIEVEVSVEKNGSHDEPESSTGKVVSLKEPEGDDDDPPSTTVSSDVLTEELDEDIKESASPKQQEELAKGAQESGGKKADSSAAKGAKESNSSKKADDSAVKENKERNDSKKTDDKVANEITKKMNDVSFKSNKKSEDSVTKKMNSIDLEKKYESEEHSDILKLQSQKQDEGDEAATAVHMEFKFGYLKDEDPIIVYVVPSCLHCAKFLIDELNPFFNKFGQIHGVVVRFIISTPKDIFILKLLHNKYKNEKDHRAMYWTFIDYIKRVMARIDLVKPTNEQKEKFVGSKKDPDFIKFQTIASEFKFSDDEIVNAYPNASKKFEKEMLEIHEKYAKEIKEINGGSNIETPFKTRSSKKLQELPTE
jgi:hypothetical protein